MGEMVGTLGWLHKPAMISARKIAELTGEKTVVKIDGQIEERIAAKIANSTDEKIGERIGSSIGAKTGEKIVSWTGERIDRLIAERTIGQMQVANSVVLIERITSLANMVMMGERMPA